MDAGIGGRFALCLLRGSVKTEGKKSRERGNEGKAKLLQLYPLEHSSTYIEDSELPHTTSSTPLNVPNPFDRSRDFFLSLSFSPAHSPTTQSNLADLRGYL